MASYVTYETGKPAAYDIAMEVELLVSQKWKVARQDIARRPFKPFADKEGRDDSFQDARTR